MLLIIRQISQHHRCNHVCEMVNRHRLRRSMYSPWENLILELESVSRHGRSVWSSCARGLLDDKSTNRRHGLPPPLISTSSATRCFSNPFWRIYKGLLTRFRSTMRLHHPKKHNGRHACLLLHGCGKLFLCCRNTLLRYYDAKVQGLGLSPCHVSFSTIAPCIVLCVREPKAIWSGTTCRLQQPGLRPFPINRTTIAPHYNRIQD